MKINLGASRNWVNKEWAVLDHKIEKTEDKRISGDIANMDLEDKSCNVVFLSHVIEHIPHTKTQDIFMEINRVMKKDGLIRILVPNLRKIAIAYVNNDYEFFKEAKLEDESIREDLGIGGSFMNFIVSPGQDTILFNRQLNTFIAGYAHLYSYDFEMMKGILENYGFGDVRQVDFCESELEDFKTPLHVTGFEPKWVNLNKKFYKENNLTHEYKNGTYDISFTVEGFDRDPLTSLIVEAKKTDDFILTDENNFNHPSAKNYNSYAFSLIQDEAIGKKIKYIEKISKKLDDPNFMSKLEQIL